MNWGPDGAPQAGALYFWWVEALPHGPPGGWLILTTATNTWTAATWYHVATSYSAPTKELSIWINGIRENYMTVTDDVGQDLAGATLTIGRYDALYADMAIDELRLYNRSLSAEEIASLAGVTIDATVNIDPDTLNLDSKGKWVTCYVELPEGYEASDIDIDSVSLEGLLEVQQSEIQDGVLMVKFHREDLAAYLDVVLGVVPPVEVELVVMGNLTDGTPFEGSDTIRVIDEGGKK